MRYLFFYIVLIASQISLDAQAQMGDKPRESPLAVVSMKYKNAYVKVVYSKPQKKGRKIFGGLVPYGKIWRTGANEATEITLTHDLLVKDDTLKAGTYSVFTIPTKDKWTIIFNNELGQWGAYNYLDESDELRVDVPSERIKDLIWEPFTIGFEQKNEVADLVFLWSDTRVKVPLKFID